MTLHPFWRNDSLPDAAGVCDPHIVTADGNAQDLFKLIQCPQFREYLRRPNNITMLENAFDTYRAILDVLNREDA